MSGKTLAVIPARGGSKGVPRKNIALLAGRPLIWYTIEAALQSRCIDRVVVSTEDEEIACAARECGAEIVRRPAELAADDTPTLPVLQHAVGHLENVESCHVDTVVVLQPTSPLRIVGDVDRAVEKLRETGCDSVVSVCELEHPLEWVLTLDGDRVRLISEAWQKATRRQDARKAYRPNGAVYVTRRDVVMTDNAILGQDTRAIVMPFERSVDVDTELDMRLAELILGDRGKRRK
jgi:CMP-N,N'-diacetyllegionaminic acid synthase